MTLVRACLIIAITAVSSQLESVEAATIYVSTSGSDSNPGTISLPYRTISKAAQAATPGTRVIVQEGVYREIVRIPVSGAPRRLIAFQPAPGQQVIIDGSGSPPDTSLVQINANHVSFRGFTIRNSTRTGIAAWGTQHVSITDNKVHGSYRAGIWIGHTEAGQSSRNLIARNEIWDNCLENKSRTWSSGWPQAIGLHASDVSVVRGNRVYRNYCEGIGAQSTKDVKIIGNNVSDSYSVNIYLDNAPGSVVQRNSVYHTYNANFYRYGRPARGIQIANEYTGIELPSSGITVSHNTLAGVGEVTYGNYQRASGLVNSIITSNTILSSPKPLW
ncbi:right-handed parallel beta-helix repeat-containing protein [Microvirga sp. ACRRW]|uniref:right-handed parallel beta-helix repeat-containing protein n=1 Tax=Microvirga sp. ACRRW TaxID=2918205 RepID=UPI001EF6E470|nr:right-handed parallel beta-helix repeat-containing protein [Microvirga sp. ACRRW]MCG7391572.1 right-handed parallel beta-helix repeat-containing protein [Microvirga sp. ACRRW]